MDRDQALHLLQNGPEGVKGWNAWRQELVESAKTSGPPIKKTTVTYEGQELEGYTAESARRLRLRNRSWILKHLPPLNDVNLDGANLCNVNLSWMNLYGSSLRGTQLCEANLVSTNLTRVSLRRANLAGAHLGKTIFADSDLSEVQGLETVQHSGPSEISVATLYHSSVKAPGFHHFLRGIGVPEALIGQLPSITEYYSCFISYSHEDRSFAHKLHEQLERRGINSWLDEKRILPGDEIYTEVDRGIRLWDKMLICCSKSSLRSWWVDNELTTVFEKEQTLQKERGRQMLVLIPLDLDGYLLSADCTYPKAPQIRKRSCVKFAGWEQDNEVFEEQLEPLLKHCEPIGVRECSFRHRSCETATYFGEFSCP